MDEGGGGSGFTPLEIFCHKDILVRILHYKLNFWEEWGAHPWPLAVNPPKFTKLQTSFYVANIFSGLLFLIRIFLNPLWIVLYVDSLL